MTFQRLTISGMSADEQGKANDLLARLHARHPRNLRRSEYYDGKHALRQLSAVAPGRYDRLGLVLGWAAKAVDAPARRCHLEGFTWAGGDLDGIGLSEFADDNMLMSELSGARTLAFTHGVSFLVNTAGGEGEPSSLLHVKDALNGTGTWNERAKRLDNFVSVVKRDRDTVAEFSLYLDGLTVTARKEPRGWVVVNRHEHDYGVPVEPMVYRPQNRTFGYSRITRPVMGIQDAAIRALIRMEGHMDRYSYPEMIILGADGGAFQDENGNPVQWLSALGRAKGIPDDDEQAEASLARADVKQFPAQNPDAHLAQLNALAKLFAREASLPDTAVAITDLANPTSEGAYDASQYELVAEAEGACDDFDRPTLRAVRRGLLMLNGLADEPESWRSIDTNWRSARFESRAAVADAGAKIAATVPGLVDTDVGLELLGLTPEQIARFRAERRRVDDQVPVDAAASAQTELRSGTPQEMKAKFDALGVAIRSGVDPHAAAVTLGLAGISFTGATPVSLRLPESDAARLEDK